SCGFSKVICISQIDRFLLRHLSDRYVDSLGVPLATVRRQIDALERVAGGALSAAQLIEPATALDDGRWDKRYHAVVAPATLAAVPAGARRVLSLGSGSGNLEAELIRLGHTVTAIPLDAVIGEVAAERGVIVTSPELGAALAELSGQRFDALVADDVLARFEDPVGVLGALRPLLSPGAVVVATAPNVAKEKLRAALGRTELAAPSSFEFDRDGLHSAGPAVLGSWLRSAGYAAPRRVGGAAGLASRAVEPLRSPMHVVAARRPPGRSERPRSAGATGSNGADPTVSVGLPVYNGENYLAGCIESVLNQDFEDFELVVSDNCSTDGTEHIAREAAARDPRVRYERLDANRGAAFNYNATFRRSRGRYFTWLAHDDLRHQRFLSSCVAALDAAPASVVLVQPRARFIDAEGRDAGVDSDVLDARWPRPARRLGRVLANVNQANAVFGVIRADALERTRLIGPFIASDYVLLAELSLLGEFWQLDEELMLRRVHPGASRHANRTDAEVARWFDPAARVPRLSARQRLAIEYTRSVLRQPLSPAQRGTALLTVPTVMGARQARNALGRWRRRAMQTVAAGRGHR
ncbi:MAG: glycosyltransferase, partial [Acidimicrobiia bacterium]|nr:glycosyltransferase [Acidimicrobiia bacterium]